MNDNFDELHLNLIRVVAPKINNIAEGNSDEQTIISLAEAISSVFRNFGCNDDGNNKVENLSDFFKLIRNKEFNLHDEKDRNNIDDLFNDIKMIVDVNFSSEKNKYFFCYTMIRLIPELLSFAVSKYGEKFVEVPLSLVKKYEESKNIKNMKKSLKKIIEKEIEVSHLDVCIMRIQEITNKLAYEISHQQS